MTDTSVLRRPAGAGAPPKPQPDWALFLDVDGTLLDIAATPDGVVVPPDLVSDLTAASAALGGALAVVSGRMLSEVDQLLAPLQLPGAGEHGAVVRLPSGQMDEIDAKISPDWIEALNEAAVNKPGTLIEPKTHGLVAHFRQAPAHEAFFGELCARLVAARAQEFEVLHGKMMFEIRPRSVSKARPVERLMAVAPFKGRRPVFVGDDVTDEDGMRAAIELGGEGYNVHESFGGRAGEVRRWLKLVAAL
jgi:trehalose 6-phosphate phosphatase